MEKKIWEEIQEIFRKAIRLTEKSPWLIPVSFFLINLFIKSFNFTKVSYDLDEAWHTFFAQKSVSEVIRIAGTDPNGPFYNLLLHFWMLLFGISEFSTRSLSVLLSAATAPLIYIFGKKYFNKKAGIFSALIFSFSNLHFFFSHIARVYALISLLSVLSFILLMNLIKTKKWTDFLLLALVNTFLLYTHLTTSFFIVTESLAAFLFFRESKRGVIMCVSANASSALLAAPWFLFTPYYHEPLHGIWLNPPIWNDIKNTLFDFSGSENMLYLFLFLFVASSLTQVKNSGTKTGKERMTLFLWFLIPLICSFVVSKKFVPIFSTKYVMVSSLGLFLSVGYALSLLKAGNRTLIFIIGFIIWMSMATLGVKEYTAEDWRTAVKEVKKRKTDRTLIIISPKYQDVSFSYYYNPSYYNSPDSMNKFLMRDRILLGSEKSIIIQHPTDYDDIILLTSHEEVVSPDSLIAFLKENFVLSCDTSFSDIRMYCFERKYEYFFFADNMESDALCFLQGNVIQKSFAHSGKNVCLTDSSNRYSNTFHNTAGAISKSSTYLKACGWVYYEKKIANCLFVSAFENKDGPYQYNAVSISEFGPPDKWFQICKDIEIPADAEPSNIVKIYFWNKGTSPAYIDDVEITEFN
ncbi:MAG: glycosyltransferase family 39 protein [Bacteroidia bacterium]|nr:glycosyltransferase family 39 protein [Bacteroidia bacterium]